jgi:hypothetical protein
MITGSSGLSVSFDRSMTLVMFSSDEFVFLEMIISNHDRIVILIEVDIRTR